MMMHRFAGAAVTAVALVYAISAPAPATAAPEKKADKPILSCKTKGADGLGYTIIKAGKGEQPGPDAKAEVNYSGRLASDGTIFDSGKAAKFKVGGVIPGFAKGLQMMQPGGKYRLCIPAALGYGAAGTGPIPANADLVFDVEMLAFTTLPPKPIIAAADRTCAQLAASGLGYALITAGAGRTPTDADIALVDFTIFDPETGVIAEKRDWEKIPLAQALPIFGEALKMMQVGGTSRFCMPTPTGEGAATEKKTNIIVSLLDVRSAPVEDE
jgi:FKBP-type peptidyl-prolyl cis-trans isomerase